MGEHRRGDAADQNEAQDRDCKYSHFQVQIDGMPHSRSTSRRKTVREARVRTAAIAERDATNGGGCPLPGPAPPRCGEHVAVREHVRWKRVMARSRAVV